MNDTRLAPLAHPFLSTPPPSLSPFSPTSLFLPLPVGPWNRLSTYVPTYGTGYDTLEFQPQDSVPSPPTSSKVLFASRRRAGQSSDDGKEPRHQPSGVTRVRCFERWNKYLPRYIQRDSTCEPWKVGRGTLSSAIRVSVEARGMSDDKHDSGRMRVPGELKPPIAGASHGCLGWLGAGPQRAAYKVGYLSMDRYDRAKDRFYRYAAAKAHYPGLMAWHVWAF